ncbi:MAG: hypothetical protein LBF28_00870 [Rickettsiales bacterium]|jgi:hypothetical protein|nr:hypothetical protein [Rickettsiales bacterium]
MPNPNGRLFYFISAGRMSMTLALAIFYTSAYCQNNNADGMDSNGQKIKTPNNADAADSGRIYNLYDCDLEKSGCLKDCETKSEKRIDIDKFIQFASAMNPKIKIETIIVRNTFDIRLQQGFYNPKTDTITLYVHKVPDDEHGLIYYDNESKSCWSRDGMKVELDMLNECVVAIAVHEFKHFCDRNAYSRGGFTIPQIAQINLHEEITARIAEMLLMRANNRLGFSHAGYESGMFPKNNPNTEHVNDYKEYLSGRAAADHEISHEEIDFIIEKAIKAFNSFNQYSNAITNLTLYDIIGNFRRHALAASCEDDDFCEKSTGFDSAINSTYSFRINGRNINFLKQCSPRIRRRLMGFTHKFLKRKNFRSKIEAWEKQAGAYESKSRDFAAAAGFSQYSEYDVWDWEHDRTPDANITSRRLQFTKKERE